MIELGRAGRDRWLLYQASIGSPVYDILAARAEPKLVNYHNITPAALLRDWEPAVAYEVALGRTQLARLAPQSRFAVADSAFNESELHALGYEGTAVVPLLIDMHVEERRARSRAGARPWRAARRARAGPTCSTSGRSRPTRRRTISSRCSTSSAAPTTRRPACTWSARRSGRPTSRRCGRSSTSSASPTSSNLAGSVSGAELEAYFQAADVFVMASDHEGFCVPLAEAMGHGVPIVAYGVTAVPETVGGAGLVLRRQVAGAVRGRRRAGAARRRRCARCWRRPGGSGRPASTWRRRRGASSSLVQAGRRRLSRRPTRGGPGERRLRLRAR